MVSKRKMVKCPWCKYNLHGCKPEDCDFRTLPMEKGAILERMKNEVNMMNALKRSLLNDETLDEKRTVVDIFDRAKGLDIMFSVLQREFGMDGDEVKLQLPKVEKFSAADSLRLAVRFKMIERGSVK